MPASKDATDARAVFSACERFLSGHGPRRPRAMLDAVLEELAEGESQDVYGKGALIEDFEAEVAELLGKPAAVFMPSGTMAQQIALRIWCERADSRRVAFHPTCHLELHEQQGYARLHGIEADLIGRPDGLIALSDLQALPAGVAALLLELPQREIGGQLPSWDALCAQSEHARQVGIALHLDGARLWEAQPFYGRTHAEIAAHFDSVYVSFYKGIGGISGACLAGPEDFVNEARIWLRRHGGNLYALYPYVLSARRGLRERLPRFEGYYRRAQSLAAALREIPGLSLTPDPPQTNMMHLHLAAPAEAVNAAVVEIARQTRVHLLFQAQPGPVPESSTTEVAIGDAAAEIDDEEAAQLFRQLMSLA